MSSLSDDNLNSRLGFICSLVLGGSLTISWLVLLLIHIRRRTTSVRQEIKSIQVAVTGYLSRRVVPSVLRAALLYALHYLQIVSIRRSLSPQGRRGSCHSAHNPRPQQSILSEYISWFSTKICDYVHWPEPPPTISISALSYSASTICEPSRLIAA